jgi:CheY-like chemotaxis protein
MGVRFVDPDQLACRRLEWFILNSTPEPGQIGTGPRARKLKVVIVEDDPLQSRAAAAPFEERGDEVRICQDGLEALGSCLHAPPDAILSDVQMPKLDGWQLLRMLRARPTLAKTPVLFLTQLASEEDRLKGYRLGVDDYIPKPYDASELVARTDRAVVRSDQHQQAAMPADVDALQGDLEQVSLQSILAFLEVERRTGVLRVGPVTNAFIYVREGQPVRVERHGSEVDATSKELLFDLLGLSVGRFDFRPAEVSGPDEIGMRTSAILLEYAKFSDEEPFTE